MKAKSIATILATILLSIPNTSIADKKEVDLTEILIASQNDSGGVTNQNKVINYDTDVELYAVGSDGTFYYTDAENLVIGGEEIPEELIFDFPEEYSTSWFKVESDSRGKNYSNTNPIWHWDSLDYSETPISENMTSLNTNVAPTVLTPTILNGIPVGTMRYKLVIEKDGETISTPGINSKYKGGISEEVHRISKRGNRNNPILDNAFSLCNNPYIWGSASWNGSVYDNQAEKFVGSDCADLCVASARLAGYTELPYSGSRELAHSYCKTIAEPVSINREGVYFNENGEQIEINKNGIRIGDFIYWTGHIGILSKDNPPFGILNKDDEVLHTFGKAPEEEKIKHIYPGRKFKIVRPVIIE